MTGIQELSLNRRKMMLQRIEDIMKDEFGIDQKSVNEFWQIFLVGTEQAKRA